MRDKQVYLTGAFRVGGVTPITPLDIQNGIIPDESQLKMLELLEDAVKEVKAAIQAQN